jgi:hypothetical protein
LASLEDFVNNDLVKAYFDLRSQQPFVKKFDTFVKRLIDVVSDYLNIQAEASAAATMVRP